MRHEATPVQPRQVAGPEVHSQSSHCFRLYGSGLGGCVGLSCMLGRMPWWPCGQPQNRFMQALVRLVQRVLHHRRAAAQPCCDVGYGPHTGRISLQELQQQPWRGLVAPHQACHQLHGYQPAHSSVTRASEAGGELFWGSATLSSSGYEARHKTHHILSGAGLCLEGRGRLCYIIYHRVKCRFELRSGLGADLGLAFAP